MVKKAKPKVDRVKATRQRIAKEKARHKGAVARENERHKSRTKRLNVCLVDLTDPKAKVRKQVKRLRDRIKKLRAEVK